MSVIPSKWIGSWATSSSASPRLPKRFAPVKLLSSIGKEPHPQSTLSADQPDPDPLTSPWRIFLFIIFRTPTAWNSKSKPNLFPPDSPIFGQDPGIFEIRVASARLRIWDHDS